MIMKNEIRAWIPHRQPSDRHFRVYQSPNWKVYLGLGSDIYAFHLDIGPLNIAWEAKELRSKHKR